MDTYTRRRGTPEAVGSESGGGGQSETPRGLPAWRREWRVLGEHDALFVVPLFPPPYPSLPPSSSPHPRFSHVDDTWHDDNRQNAHATARASMSPFPEGGGRREGTGDPEHAGNWRNWRVIFRNCRRNLTILRKPTILPRRGSHVWWTSSRRDERNSVSRSISSTVSLSRREVIRFGRERANLNGNRFK